MISPRHRATSFVIDKLEGELGLRLSQEVRAVLFDEVEKLVEEEREAAEEANEEIDDSLVESFMEGAEMILREMSAEQNLLGPADDDALSDYVERLLDLWANVGEKGGAVRACTPIVVGSSER